ncbi:unnamed protein product [Allacma fusca]|uniref:alpha-glucosidase n=1 Tax=Allacma fusca TaxID=39272 RepID=A0A8J2PLS1_9HEXA|nr:unnamed protein product [Allacma fusca]
MKYLSYIVFIAILHTTVSTRRTIIQEERKPLEWWQQTVVYQIYPRSFQDSDGDGVGDINGIISKLDYLLELGIGAVWISPIYESPMVDFGYDISNFTRIDPIFGTDEDFKRMAAEFKKRDMKLIMDMVPNHSSDLHDWFQKSIDRIEPYTDYYVWRDANSTDADGKPVPPNNWVSLFGGSAWEWNDKRQQFYLHQFAKQQPDLNFDNIEVLDFLADMRRLMDVYSKADGRVRCMMVEAGVPDKDLGEWATFLIANHDQPRLPTKFTEEGIDGDKVLGISRIPPANSTENGLLLLANLSNEEVTVDSIVFPGVPSAGTVRLRSTDFKNRNAYPGSTIDTRSVLLGARNSIVIEFTPI